MKKTFFAFLLLLSFSPMLGAEENSGVMALARDADPGRARLGAALEKGLKAYENVRDYKAVFQKQESSGND